MTNVQTVYTDIDARDLTEDEAVLTRVVKLMDVLRYVCIYIYVYICKYVCKYIMDVLRYVCVYM